MEKVGENYLEKTMNHFVLPFLYEAMLVKRQDSHLLSFRRGVGGKTWRSRSVWWNRWSIMLEEVWNEISSPLLLFWFEIVCWNRFRSFLVGTKSMINKIGKCLKRNLASLFLIEIFFFVIWDCLRSFQIVFSVWMGMKSIILEDIWSLGLFEIILKIGEKIFK